MVYKFIVLTVILLCMNPVLYPGSNPGQESTDQSDSNSIGDIYTTLGDSTLKQEAFILGMLGYKALVLKGLVTRDNIITIIDYSKPSSECRFYVIDLDSESICYKSLVAHGRNSGELYAGNFSNRMQSHQTALGFYITGNAYNGAQGYSLLMAGVDTGYNDNAIKRSIVIHGADYATKQYVEKYGRLGRSLGCPALPPDIADGVIDLIKEGSVIFSYYPDKNYLNGSVILTNGTSNSHEGI